MNKNIKKDYSKNELVRIIKNAAEEIVQLKHFIQYLKSELKKYELLQNSLTNIVENKKKT